MIRIEWGIRQTETRDGDEITEVYPNPGFTDGYRWAHDMLNEPHRGELEVVVRTVTVSDWETYRGGAA